MDRPAQIGYRRENKEGCSPYPFLMNGIQVEGVETCLFCRQEGALLYDNLRDRIFEAPGLWRFVGCPHCRLIWLNPRPTLGEIQKAYAQYYTHHVLQPKPAAASLRKKIKRAILSGTFGYRHLARSWTTEVLGKVLSVFPFLRGIVVSRVMYLHGSWAGKLLDVGCGNGWFIAQMRDLGWDVLGLEPDALAAKQAHEQHGVAVHIGSLEEAGLPDDSFDAITMHHVIEHVPHPNQTLRECARLLKPNGRLVIMTPNIQSLGHKVFREAWLHLDPPRHLYLFSHQALFRGLELAGLKLVALRTISRLTGTWSGSSLIRKNGRWPGVDVGCLSRRLKIEGQIFRLIENIGQLFWRLSGDELLVISSKRT